VIHSKQNLILELLARQNEWTLDSDLNSLSGGTLGSYSIVTAHLLSLQRQGLIDYDAFGLCRLTEAGKGELAS